MPSNCTNGLVKLKRWNFAIAGTGSMANRMLSTFWATKAIDVKLVISGDDQRAARFIEKNQLAANPCTADEINAYCDIDAIYIATGNERHLKLADFAVRNGIAVLIEKPLTVSFDETQRIIDLAKAKNVLLLETLWTKFLPGYQAFTSQVRANKFGRVGLLRADFGYQSAAIHDTQYDNLNQGVTLDRLIYPLALALDILGDVERVDAATMQPIKGFDSHLALLLKHRAGGISQLAVSRDVQLSNVATAYCQDAIVNLAEPMLSSECIQIRNVYPYSGDNSNVKQTTRTALKRLPLLRQLASIRSPYTNTRLHYGTDQYLPMVKHFLHLLSTGAKSSDIHPQSSSLALAKVMDYVRKVV
jgi:predicted dehydrogenase